MKIAVVGAGNGGQAVAAYMKKSGCQVHLYNRTNKVLDDILSNGGIELTGLYQGLYMPDLMTSDIRKAIKGCDIIFFTIPSNVHYEVSLTIANSIEKRQIIILNPGRTFGAYDVSKALKDGGCNEDINICETDTFLFTCRTIKNGLVNIFYQKNQVKIASIFKERTHEIVKYLQPYFPNLICAKDVLETGFTNVGMIFHPVPMLLNISRIEQKNKYLHYIHGITPSIANYIQKMDDERICLSNSIGVCVQSAMDWIKKVYGSKGNSLYELLQNTSAYNEVYAPDSLECRYIYEEMLTGVVPFVALGRYLNIKVPTLQSALDLASIIMDYDFYKFGRNEKRINFNYVLNNNKYAK